MEKQKLFEKYVDLALLHAWRTVRYENTKVKQTRIQYIKQLIDKADERWLVENNQPETA